MKINKYIVIGISILLLLTIILTYLIYKEPNYAYVEINVLYKDFTYKIELQKKVESLQLNRKNILDSLEFELKLLSRKIDNEENQNKSRIDTFFIKKNQFLTLKQDFSNEIDQLSETYDNQIYQQISQYVFDYGKIHDYTYIFGATGSGSIMYADERENITIEVLDYINKRYKGDAN
jgi:outer membrane protein